MIRPALGRARRRGPAHSVVCGPLHVCRTGRRGSIVPVMPQQVPSVTVADLPDGVTMLDVREPDEWAAGHAPDAVHIPLGELAGWLGELPEGESVYVVCRGGGRSAKATAYLNAN